MPRRVCKCSASRKLTSPCWAWSRTWPGSHRLNCPNKYFIFGENGGRELAARHDVPLLGQLPLVQSIRENGDQGRPAVLDPESTVGKLFADLAEAVARQVSIRNNVAPKTAVVQMKS